MIAVCMELWVVTKVLNWPIFMHCWNISHKFNTEISDLGSFLVNGCIIPMMARFMVDVHVFIITHLNFTFLNLKFNLYPLLMTWTSSCARWPTLLESCYRQDKISYTLFCHQETPHLATLCSVPSKIAGLCVDTAYGKGACLRQVRCLGCYVLNLNGEQQFNGNTHTHAHTHARTHARAHTHTHTRTHTHARTHTHGRIHTHVHIVIVISRCSGIRIHFMTFLILSQGATHMYTETPSMTKNFKLCNLNLEHV